MSPLQPQTIEEILNIIREDVRDIKLTLNGSDGLVAKVEVLESSKESLKWHFTMLWSAIVALSASAIRIIWK
jgi:hypothetical protein